MLPLIFIPGLLCDERLWRDQSNALSELARSMTADVTSDNNLGAMAAKLLRDAPPKFNLIALSMGGYVAFELLRQASDRVNSLALFDTSAAPDSPGRSAEREAALASLDAGRFVGVTRHMLPRLIDKRHISGNVGLELQAMAERVGKSAFVRQQSAILHRPDSRPLLGSITIPTLVGVGDSDVLTPPSESVTIFQALPRPSFHLFHRCGHLPAIEQPENCTEVLRRWLVDAVR